MKTFNPWGFFKSGEVIKPLVIQEPPCKYCQFWSPRAITDDKGGFAGVQLCMSESMHHDFSCFKPCETPTDTDIAPHTRSQPQAE